MKATVPSLGPRSSWARASAVGSIAMYTKRHDGSIAWATWWKLSALGILVPMLRNCRMPASAVR